MVHPTPGLLGLLSAVYENMVCEPEFGTRCLLLLTYEITAKALEIRVQAEHRGAEVYNDHWPLEKHTFENQEKTALSMAKKKTLFIMMQ